MSVLVVSPNKHIAAQKTPISSTPSKPQSSSSLKAFFKTYPYTRLKKALDSVPSGSRIHLSEKFTAGCVYLQLLPLESDAEVKRTLSIEVSGIDLKSSYDDKDFIEELTKVIGTQHNQLTMSNDSIHIQFFNEGDIVPLVNVAIK